MNYVAQYCRASVFFTMALVIGLFSSPEPVLAQSETAKSEMLELWSPGEPGQRMRIRGRVTSIDGTPLPDVAVRFRHADSEGYDFSYYQGTVHTNSKGAYQFGSVIPGNSHRLSHVHVYVIQGGYQYLETEFYFKDDPKAAKDDPNAIFLEAGTVNEETMMFGRFDIVLVPQ